MDEILNQFVQDVQHLFKGDLVAVYLYGSAVTGEHVAGRSDINTAVVLHDVTPDLLRRASSHLRFWHRQGMATPLFVDPDFIRTSLDVFPIEFADMRDRHRVLWGPDLLADLAIERANIRRQCEQELRGKLLKLRQTYVEAAHTPKQLEAILTSAAASVIVLSRTLLYLAGEESGGGSMDVLEGLERRFGSPTDHFRKAVQLKRGEIRVAGAGLELLYHGALGEFDQLVKVVDGLPA
jgi:hypothetical protein